MLPDYGFWFGARKAACEVNSGSSLGIPVSQLLEMLGLRVEGLGRINRNCFAF